MGGYYNFAILRHTIIRKMRVPVRDLFEIKVGSWEANVRLRVDPNSQRVPVRHEDPLSDVKLATLHYHSVFDVLLHHVQLPILLIADPRGLILVPYHVKNLTEVLLEVNSTTTRTPRRLHDPDVSFTVQVELWVNLAQLVQDLHSLGKLGIFLTDLLVCSLLGWGEF